MIGKQFNKIKIDYGTVQYYRFYKSRYIKLNPEQYDISSSLYFQILSEYNQEIMYRILDHAFEFKVPFNLGTVSIRKYKPQFQVNKDGKIINRLPVNPIETKKLWDKNPEAKDKKIFVRYLNKHSDGFVFKLNWMRNKAKFKNKTIYKVGFKRTFKRLLVQRIKEKSIDAFLL